MALIQIPYVKQAKGSTMCGLACAAMIFKFYKEKKIDQSIAFNEIKEISTLGRYYCKTHKISQYLTQSGLSCTVIRYTNLKDFLLFCNSNSIAPIINHRSFEDNIGGHFSVVKNVIQHSIIVNDPENKNRKIVSFSEILHAVDIKNHQDEIGGRVAIIPNILKKEIQYLPCSKCYTNIDITTVRVANMSKKIIEHIICNHCDSAQII